MSANEPIYEQQWTADAGKTSVVVNYELDGATRVTREAMQLLLANSGYEMVRETPYTHEDA